MAPPVMIEPPATLTYEESRDFFETEPALPDDGTYPDPGPEDTWDIGLTVPASRAGDIFSAFSMQEQMSAIAFVLQQRMDAILTA